MKKILMLFVSLLLIASLSACGGVGTVGNDGNTVVSTSSEEAASSKPEVSALNDSEVEDTIAGLQKYLTSIEGVEVKADEPMYEFIGATAGTRFTYSYEGTDNVSMELYEFKSSEMNDETKTMIESIKSDGKFVLFGHEVEATLSDSGKYMLIYRDTANAELNLKHKEAVTNAFKSFKK